MRIVFQCVDFYTDFRLFKKPHLTMRLLLFKRPVREYLLGLRRIRRRLARRGATTEGTGIITAKS